MRPAGPLSGGCSVETLGTQKHRPPPWYHSHPPQLISDWMPGGDLTEYIKKHPDAGRIGLVGVPPLRLTPRLLRHQLSDVAEGLQLSPLSQHNSR
jgi:serine/threonine protein kinase